MIKTYPMSGKWIYIFSTTGCSLVSTNSAVSFKIPAGFFALNRDEIQQYFSNNYLTVNVDDTDILFECFSYDFVINSVQPLSDVTSSMILQILSDLQPVLNSINNYSRINQNNTGMLLNAYLEQNTVEHLGSVMGLFNSTDNCFEVYLPDGLSKFDGQFVFSPSATLVNSNASFGGGYSTVFSYTDLFYIDSDYSTSNLGAFHTQFSSGSIVFPIKFYSSSGVLYQNVSLSNVVNPVLRIDGKFNLLSNEFTAGWWTNDKTNVFSVGSTITFSVGSSGLTISNSHINGYGQYLSDRFGYTQNPSISLVVGFECGFSYGL